MDSFNQTYSSGEQVVGMLYVPDQIWDKVYKIDQGFMRGTVFPELDKPWIGGYGRG